MDSSFPSSSIHTNVFGVSVQYGSVNPPTHLQGRHGDPGGGRSSNLY
jgi:hypothetical protein